MTHQLRLPRFAWTAGGLFSLAAILSLLNPLAGLPVFGYLATLCLLAALSCLAPICIQALGFRPRRAQDFLLGPGGTLRQIAVSHAARHPGRNGVTVSALMIGLAIMIGVVVMVRSFRQTVELWVNETVIADMVVAPSAWLHGRNVGQASRALPGTWAAKLASIDGVAAVDTYRDVHVDVQGQSWCRKCLPIDSVSGRACPSPSRRLLVSRTSRSSRSSTITRPMEAKWSWIGRSIRRSGMTTA